MKKIYIPRDYQWGAIRFLLSRKGAALFADPGLGKTSIILYLITIIKKFRPDYRVLVIGPLPVVLNTWPEECSEWADFSGLTFEVLYGKKRVEAAKTEADLHFLNAENIFWLFDLILQEFDEFPYDMLVVDESTLFKTWGSKRTKVLRKFRSLFDRVICLTGTPTPNSLLDIFSQMFLVDGGETLGRFITHFQKRYFFATGYKNKELAPYETSEAAITKKTARNALRIQRDEVYDMPECNEVIVPVELPPKVRAIYNKFEKSLFAEMEGDELFSPTGSASYGICRQIAAGGLYEPEGLFIDPDVERKTYDTHTAKLEALARLSDELYGKPILLAYQYDFNREQLKKYKGLGKRVRVPEGPKKQKQLSKFKGQFLRGKIPILAVHPASMSHGLNMHKGPGRAVAWLSPTNNLEHYIQFNERVYRPGVGSNVTIYIFIAKNTIDEAVFADLKSNDNDQRSFLNALKKYRKKRESK